ncbi:glycosyltransferase family 2 protein [bacterium]|nr:glycosyltransferase family 2 protein [bacterium]
MTLDVREIVRPAHETPPGEKLIAVLPAYNAERTLERTLRDFPKQVVDEIILVDDVSKDNTVELAEAIGLTVIRHTRNRGYGGNQKTCYRAALDRGADYVIMIHPDYQYDSRVIDLAIGFIKLGICDVVLGSRIRTRREALDGGMPLVKYLANRGLTIIENVVLGQNVSDFHTGFRAYRREVLERIPFDRNSDDFFFDSQFLVQCVNLGYRMGDIPVPVRYFDEASSVSISRSTLYAFQTMGLLVQYWAHRLRIWKTAILEPVQSETADELTSSL